MGDLINTILHPIELIVAWIMYGWHQLFTAIGMPPAAGITWALSIVGLVVVMRAAMIPLFVRQIHASRRMQRAGQQAAATAEAEKRLRSAQQGLEAAKQQWDEDRRSPDRDGRVDNRAYLDRVNEERRKVMEAEQALEAAKAGKLQPDEKAKR